MLRDENLTHFQNEISRLDNLLDSEYKSLKDDVESKTIYRSYNLLKLSLNAAFENIEVLKDERDERNKLKKIKKVSDM